MTQMLEATDILYIHMKVAFLDHCKSLGTVPLVTVNEERHGVGHSPAVPRTLCHVCWST